METSWRGLVRLDTHHTRQRVEGVVFRLLLLTLCNRDPSACQPPDPITESPDHQITCVILAIAR